MRNMIIMVLIVNCTLLIASCSKEHSTSRSTAVDTTNNNNKDSISPFATIIGKWSIVNDSFFVVGAPPFFNSKNSVYIGVAGDYYDFRSDRSLFTNENNQLDTLSYEVDTNYQVQFIYNYYNIVEDSLGKIIYKTKYRKTYTITTLTGNYLTLAANLSSAILTPEGYFDNILKLKK